MENARRTVTHILDGIQWGSAMVTWLLNGWNNAVFLMVMKVRVVRWCRAYTQSLGARES